VKELSLGKKNILTVTNPASDALGIVIAPATGLFKGSFVYPGQDSPTAFSGVLIQNQTGGGGFFIGPNGAGNVSLMPQ
jgi:hypothetical protein